MRYFVLALVIFGGFAACTFREKPAEPEIVNVSSSYQHKVEEGKLLVREGDLLVRNGNDLTSQFIRDFSKRDKNYSHSEVL